VLRIILVVLLVGVAGAACKSGGASDSRDATPVSDEAFLWAAQQAVNASLITENDLPANFDLTTGGDENQEETEPEFLLTGECAEFNEQFNSNVDGNWRNSVAESETGDFEDPDGDEFSSSAAAFRDASAADAEAGDMDRFFDTCTEQFETQFVQYLGGYLQEVALEEGKAVLDVSTEVTEISVPSQGDWSHAVRMDMTFTVDGLPVRLVSDTVTVRVGRMVGSVDATYTGELEASLEAQRDGIVAIMADRLAAENAKLPG